MAGALFSHSSPRIAPASQEAFAFVKMNLQEREIHIAKSIGRYCRETGWPDVTGGELAAYLGESVVSVRPRITGLLDKGWLHSGAIRSSRVPGERRCHPVWLSVPEAAIERIGK